MKWTDDSSSGVSSKRLCSWRPAWEGMSAMAGFAGSITTAMVVPGTFGVAVSSALGLFATVRALGAGVTLAKRVPLAGFAPTFINYPMLVNLLKSKASGKKNFKIKPIGPAWLERYDMATKALMGEMILDARREGPKIDSLWFGRGFQWLPRHAQALYELTNSPVDPVRLPKKVRKACRMPKALRPGDIGNPILHGVGAHEEDDLLRPLSSLGGGTLIVGTTQAGKGVMLTSLIAQAIFRGEPVIIIDPKSSKRLRGAIWHAAKMAGRAMPLEFHPAFPERGVRLDPLGAWTRPTELATRIAAVLPPDSGAFGNFAWMAVNVAVEGLFYVTERPSLLSLRKILEGGIDRLLSKLYLSKYLSRVNKHIWRDKWGILKTYVTA